MLNQFLVVIFGVHLLVCLLLFYKKKRKTYLFLAVVFSLFLASISLQYYLPDLNIAGKFVFEWLKNAAWFLSALILAVFLIKKTVSQKKST